MAYHISRTRGTSDSNQSSAAYASNRRPMKSSNIRNLKEVSNPPVVFSPSDVSGMVAWFKADALSLNDNDPVGTWTDSSANGNDALQATAGNKPLYKTNIVNGKPVVRFDGSDDYLQTAAFTATSSALTFFIVGKGDADVANAYISDGQTLNKGCFIMETGKVTFHAGGAQLSFTTADFYTQFSYVTIVANGASSSINVNGGTPVTGTTNSAAFTQITLAEGGDLIRTNFDGDMAEWILYDGAVSAEDITSIETYFADKYAIT